MIYDTKKANRQSQSVAESTLFLDRNIYYQQIRMELSHKLKKGRTVQFNS